MSFWGTAQVYLDGKLLAESAGTVKLKPGVRPAKTLTTGSRILGHVEGKVKPGVVEGDFFFQSAAEAIALCGARNATLQVELDNGQRFVVRQAAQCAEEPDIQEGESGGRVTGLRFEGMPAEAVTAAPA